MSTTTKDQKQRLPEWFRQTKRKTNATRDLGRLLDKEVPNSICQEAKCPNRGECFEKGVLTFLVLGTVCTRNCSFCSVRHGKPMPPNPAEVDQVLHAVERLNLKFVVLTSPNRDDLPDGGAAHYVKIIEGVRAKFPHVKTEVLIPDFQGDKDVLKVVVDAKPAVINHNIETVPSLYRAVRKGSLYGRSLDVLSNVKEMDSRMLSKTGIMLGLGEEHDELLATFKDVAQRGVDIFTMGQYLKPAKENADVVRYYTPEEFEMYKRYAEEAGIRYVFSGPLVRSSYLAENVFEDVGMEADLFG